MDNLAGKKWFLAVFAAALALITAALYVAVDLHYTTNAFTFPLDDSYIYLHYARNAADGHWFQYNVGDATTTGATSYLYLILVTLLALAFRGADTLVWAAFGLNVVIYGTGIYFFARVVRGIFNGRHVVLSTLIFVTTGAVTYHTLGGMDAGLFILCLLAALRAYGLFLEEGKSWPFAAALGLLVLSRPEGILAAALFVAFALVAAYAGVPNGAPVRRPALWPLGLGLVPVPLYFLANYLLGGNVYSASYLSKSNWSPGTYGWTENVIESMTYGFYVVKNVLGGMEGTYLKNVYNGNIPQASVAYFPPLALAFFLVGWGRAARKSWPDRRPSVAFVAGAIFLAVVALSCWSLPFPRHFSRYIVPLYPFFIIGVLVGIEGLATLIRYGRPAITQRSMWWTGAAYFLVFGLMSSVYFCFCFGLSARDIRFQHIAVAEFIRQKIPAEASVIAHDVGAIAYYGGHRVLDVEGLITRDGWLYGPEGIGCSSEFVKTFGKPGDFAAVYLNIYPYHEVGILQKPAFEADLFTHTIAGGKVMTVCPISDIAFEEAVPFAAAAEPAYELADALDVAEPLSEAAHDYKLHRRAGNRFSSFAEVKTLSRMPTRYVFEAGRVVSGAEEFTMRAAPGRDMFLAVRCEPPFLARVSVDGNPLGRWEVPGGEESYADGYFPIPGRMITSRLIHVRLEGLRKSGNFDYNRPVRYALFTNAGRRP